MLVFAIIAVLMTAALVVRLAPDRAQRRDLIIVGIAALLVRLAMVGVAYTFAMRTHTAGIWLNDESSYWLATESLLPDTWNRSLPGGLDHLGGNGYLGLTTMISHLLGAPNSTAFRLMNAALGTAMALLSYCIAQRFWGRRPALVAGLVVAVWPPLVLWSATILRDTLCGLAVLAVWWALVNERDLGRVRAGCVVVLGTLLIASLRPYLAGAVVIGVAAWLVFPTARRWPAQAFAVGALAAVLGAIALVTQQPYYVDRAAHELVYRQTMTRMEGLGLLYRDRPSSPFPPEPPFVPGKAVASVDPQSGWLRTGVVHEPRGEGLVSVTYVDGTTEVERITDLELLQSARLQPLQLASGAPPALLTLVTGLGDTINAIDLVWIADAIAWDVLLVLAFLALRRGGGNVRDWLFPAIVVVATAAALVIVPGAPGNSDRHRATQTVPLLVVLAAGFLAGVRGRAGRTPLPLSSANNTPSKATTLANSRSLSPR